MIVAGPLCELCSITINDSVTCAETLLSDYIVQGARFTVYAGFGCTNTVDGSVLSILLLGSWSVTLPLFSITVYYRMSGMHTVMA